MIVERGEVLGEVGGKRGEEEGEMRGFTYPSICAGTKSQQLEPANKVLIPVCTCICNYNVISINNIKLC